MSVRWRGGRRRRRASKTAREEKRATSPDRVRGESAPPGPARSRTERAGPGELAVISAVNQVVRQGHDERQLRQLRRLEVERRRVESNGAHRSSGGVQIHEAEHQQASEEERIAERRAACDNEMQAWPLWHCQKDPRDLPRPQLAAGRQFVAAPMAARPIAINPNAQTTTDHRIRPNGKRRPHAQLRFCGRTLPHRLLPANSGFLGGGPSNSLSCARRRFFCSEPKIRWQAHDELQIPDSSWPSSRKNDLLIHRGRTSPPPVRSVERLRRLPRISPAGFALVLLGIFGFLLSRRPLWHTDLWGHLAYGRLIVTSRTLPPDRTSDAPLGRDTIRRSVVAQRSAGVSRLSVGGDSSHSVPVRGGGYGMSRAALRTGSKRRTDSLAFFVLGTACCLWVEWQSFIIVRPQLAGLFVSCFCLSA